MRTTRFFIFIFIFITAFIYYSCDDSGIATNDTFELSSFGTQDSTLLDNTIFIDTVKVLFKDIKLNVSHTNDSNNFKTGPLVVYFKTGGITSLGTAELPAGSYDKIKFEIHKLTSTETPPDPEFADTALYSVIVEGRWLDSTNNTFPFIFKSGVNAHQILAFPDSLIIATGVICNVTILAKPYIWFRSSNGTWLDPRDSNNKNEIENNIRNNVNSNIRAFKDNNRDGQPD